MNLPRPRAATTPWGAAGLVLLQDRCLVALDNCPTTLQLDFTAMTSYPIALFARLARVGILFRQHARHLQLIGFDDAVRAIVMQQPHGRAATPAHHKLSR